MGISVDLLGILVCVFVFSRGFPSNVVFWQVAQASARASSFHKGTSLLVMEHDALRRNFGPVASVCLARADRPREGSKSAPRNCCFRHGTALVSISSTIVPRVLCLQVRRPKCGDTLIEGARG